MKFFSFTLLFLVLLACSTQERRDIAGEETQPERGSEESFYHQIRSTRGAQWVCELKFAYKDDSAGVIKDNFHICRGAAKRAFIERINSDSGITHLHKYNGGEHSLAKFLDDPASFRGPISYSDSWNSLDIRANDFKEPYPEMSNAVRSMIKMGENVVDTSGKVICRHPTQAEAQGFIHSPFYGRNVQSRTCSIIITFVDGSQAEASKEISSCKGDKPGEVFVEHMLDGVPFEQRPGSSSNMTIAASVSHSANVNQIARKSDGSYSMILEPSLTASENLTREYQKLVKGEDSHKLIREISEPACK